MKLPPLLRFPLLGLAGWLLGIALLRADEPRRYELLEDLDESFRSVKRGTWVKKDSDLQLARKLFEIRDPQEGVLPPSALKFVEEGRLDDDFRKKLAAASREMEGWNAEDRKFVQEMFHQALVDDLLRRAQRRQRFSLALKERITYDTNVTQTPESLVAVSHRQGTQSATSADLKHEGRDEPYGQIATQFSYRFSDYFDSIFDNRASKSVSLSITDKFNLKKAGISFLLFGADARGDYLKTTGEFDYAFTTLTPKADLMLAPKKDWGRLSDLFITFISAGVELRDYVGANRFDANGRTKDSSTPFLTLIFMNFKNWKSHASRTTLSLIARNQNSKSDEFAYQYTRIGLSYTVTFPRWSVAPDVALSYRDQKVFILQKREDTAFEPGVTFSAKLYKDIWSASLSYKETHQDSNLSNFEFSSRQVAAGLNCTF